jgi:general secretion pathway protein D
MIQSTGHSLFFRGATTLLCAALLLPAFAQEPAEPAPIEDAQAPGRRLERPPGIRPPTAEDIAARFPPDIAPASAADDATSAPGDAKSYELKFEQAPSDILLAAYAAETGKTLLIDPAVPKATISLRSQSELLPEEYLRAIETVLVMHGISLVPDGDVFLKVLPSKDLRKLGITTELEEPDGGLHVEDGRMVSQMISLKNITIEEARKALEGFKRDSGQIQLFERTNSILVTDTTDNVNRMMEIIRFIDQPLEIRDETNVRPLKYAKAVDIKRRLEEIVAEAQKAQQGPTEAPVSRSSGAPGIVREQIPATPPGVIRPPLRRPPQAATPEPAGNTIQETLVADAERGVIRGKVQIVADERTNLLIIITRPENMAFFDRIINVLDVEVQTAPDVIVEVVRLEYAQAKDVATMLNDLIGNTSSASDTDAKTTVARKDDRTESESLAEASDRIRRGVTTDAEPAAEKKSKLGELKKEDVKILSDERSNAIIIMASKGDVETVRGIIADMDIQLSQVVIETVIVSVTFTDSNETGMDWVQRAMVSYSGKKNSSPAISFATAGGGGSGNPVNTMGLTTAESLAAAGGGISAWLTVFDLNTDLFLSAIQSDSRARLMSSPRITTMDNKEATLESTERIYWKEGSTHYDTYTTDTIKSEDVGIKLTVTPRINKRGYITLTAKQEIQANDGYESIGDSQYPKLSTRTMGADVAVQSGETVVFGGLAHNSVTRTRTKVPILGSIPLLGWLFRHDTDISTRTEIIVFLTPRVIDTSTEMEDDARNIKASLDTDGIWDSAWSHSRLADPLPPGQARKILSQGGETVMPPRNPLSGNLTGLNEEIPGATDDPEIREALDTPQGEVPFIHFSDLSSERLRGVTLDYEETSVTLAPDAAPGAAPEAPVPEEIPVPAGDVGPTAAP